MSGFANIAIGAFMVYAALSISENAAILLVCLALYMLGYVKGARDCVPPRPLADEG